MKSGERANNADGFVTDATGIVDGSYRALQPPFDPELKQILPARRAIGYWYGTLVRTADGGHQLSKHTAEQQHHQQMMGYSDVDDDGLTILCTFRFTAAAVLVISLNIRLQNARLDYDIALRSHGRDIGESVTPARSRRPPACSCRGKAQGGTASEFPPRSGDCIPPAEGVSLLGKTMRLA